MVETDFKTIETKWKAFWEKEKIYSFNKNSKKQIYSIDTPPPTVSGKMHLGHAFSYSQADFIARFQRMMGNEVFYPFGTDDNGLPTERLVEKLKNIRSKNMTRAEFIEICLKTLKEITPDFVKDWKNIGVSCDYDLYYSTINASSQKISQKSFIELYNSNIAYKAEFPTIWCPECQTPIAQAELEDKEKDTLFTTLKFKVEGNELPIATTRPELLGACVAVFVNPKDERYKKLIGKKAVVPLFNQEVIIIADAAAQIDKGTGVLMVCSYGDKYDVEAIKRHKLTPKIIFEKNGTLNIGEYKGVKIKEARRRILEVLKTANLIIEQKQIKHSVNVHDKCSTEIEFISTDQWFIKILDKKKELIEQGKNITWYPEHMFKRYENWINGLDWDWSISRERHFGVPLPVWYCKKCNETILAKIEELPVDPLQLKKTCEKCNSICTPEEKVLDTWATSSLTPEIASSLVDYKISQPYSLRPQAHDIIRTWAFYTIVKSLYHKNVIPWKNISISGFVTLGGEKMGKSKGNGISPQEIIEKYGADALRYWAAEGKLGEDLDYQEKDLVTGKKFVTKILNATNFVFMNLEYQEKMPTLEETDRLFLIELNKVINDTTKHFKDYSYSRAKLEADKFFWFTLADNYLEIVKNRVYQGSSTGKASAYYTLYHALLTIIKLMAPITPFITEEIYQTHFKKYEKNKSIHNSNWPSEIKLTKKAEDDKTWARLLEIISLVRQEKSKAKKSMKAEVILTLPDEDQRLLSDVFADLKAVINASEVHLGKFDIKIL